ncbi:hypothetical protein [Desulfosarcina ovata]|uniref:Uncharacterized protein n=1 Tax=Desulfosarcina ovata subsp. ovata TaxID=2752305 RepID=A0A5K8ADY5_9BACT|nr:hypothetical protein [Desulfosarcina ovata]BBO90160.1 hypothetical protein DSCOOX_33400 [Desulfosarcina ovata subsp. ovata]
MQEEPQDRTKVRIYTDQFIIVGEIAMFSDTRLTDYIISAHDFIAITHAQVCNLENKVLFNADFLNLQKDKVVIIVPETMMKPV